MLALPPLSLYVHIPWCVRKCPYCDFNSHTADAQLPEDAYVASVVGFLDAITRWRNALPDPARVLLAWRETYPQHFVTGDGSGLRREAIGTPTLCAPNVTGGGYAALEAQIRAQSKSGVPVVEVFDLYKDRGDLHLGQRGHDVDCTTYCYAPHLVGPLFDRAASALLREIEAELYQLPPPDRAPTARERPVPSAGRDGPRPIPRSAHRSAFHPRRHQPAAP